MGWGDCGTDSKGRNIGYVWEGVCDKEGCSVVINRGLTHSCGLMHGEADYYCEKYFCEHHRTDFYIPEFDEYAPLCEECGKPYEDAIDREDRLDGESSEENQ